MDVLNAYPKEIGLLIVVVVTASIGLSSVFTKRGRSAPRWVICALVLSASCFFIWSFLSWYLLVWGTSLSKLVHWRIMFGKTVIGSFGAGVLATLFMSGELRRRRCEGAQ